MTRADQALMPGVYLVGAGPGSLDHLTLLAARVLASADIVLHDALVGAEVLALACKARCIPVGKRARGTSVDQRIINRLLVRAGRAHPIVVRLKGGDPGLFGRAQEEINACRAAGLAVTIVPGVSAAFAAMADLGASLTARGVSRSVAFVTPVVARHALADLHWVKAVAGADTSVLYMGAQAAARVRQNLLEAGLNGALPLALIESAGTSAVKVTRGCLAELDGLAQGVGEGPVLIVLGEVVSQSSAEQLQAIAAA